MIHQKIDANEMEVRAATVDDVPAIVDIYNHAVLHTTATADYEPVTVEARTAWLQDRNAKEYAVIVAVYEEKVVGWAALNPYYLRVGYRFTAENAVYIAPDFQGCGIGTLLLERLLECARVQGLHSIIAAIVATNPYSIALHKRFGFVEVGRMREVVYKFDTWLDVVYLQWVSG